MQIACFFFLLTDFSHSLIKFFLNLFLNFFIVIRFLQNWRSRDDDTDNIILQLEQPEVTNGEWPPRISFT
jgi:hypothetical protein